MFSCSMARRSKANQTLLYQPLWVVQLTKWSNNIFGQTLNGDERSGSRILKILPLPTSLDTFASPPWCKAMCFTMAKPRPVPPISRLRAVNTVETLEQSLLMFWRNAWAFVFDLQFDLSMGQAVPPT